MARRTSTATNPRSRNRSEKREFPGTAPDDLRISRSRLSLVRVGRSWLFGALSSALILAVAGGCSGPDRPGPNVEVVPDGFFFDANASASRPIFPGTEEVDQSGWFAHNADDDHSSIMITTYAGQIPEDAIRAARDAHARKWRRKRGMESGLDYGQVEAIEIDGRPAWAWEILQYSRGDLCSIEWVAVVPYEEATYAVEFFAGMPPHMDPELIRKTVLSFEAD